MTLDTQRKEYSQQPPLDLGPDPIAAFLKWYDEAKDSSIIEPNAMTLATATQDAMPSARIVLLKGVSDEGFVFYTNFESRKGSELKQNPHAALCWYWDVLERQVRAVGTVERIEDSQSDHYFQKRPRGAQVGATVSKQSAPLASRETLEQAWAEFESAHSGEQLTRPPYWGGYLVRPLEIEFWQGASNRLHDRLRYCRSKGNSWTTEKLYP